MNYTEMVIVTLMGDVLVECLEKDEGYFFSKKALELCWEWIEKHKVEIGDLYDCLDSPEGIDFTYYEDISEKESDKIIYRILFDILAFNTKEISIVEKINRPQYLDYIQDDFYEHILQKTSQQKFDFSESIDNISRYINDKNIEYGDYRVTKEEIKRILNKM